jgi:hypothetical protein
LAGNGAYHVPVAMYFVNRRGLSDIQSTPTVTPTSRLMPTDPMRSRRHEAECVTDHSGDDWRNSA